MTRADAKERALEIWEEWKWWLAIVVFPLTVWGFRAFSDSKVGVVEFRNHIRDEQFERQADSIHHQDDDRMLRYLICRQDFSRRECLNPR